jgi:hypothetical protein
MKYGQEEKTGTIVALTTKVLNELKAKGFQYVIVNAFTNDRRIDYMEPSYFELIPIKELPVEKDKKGIYEPINSPMLAEWANAPNEGIKVFVLRRGHG